MTWRLFKFLEKPSFESKILFLSEEARENLVSAKLSLCRAESDFALAQKRLEFLQSLASSHTEGALLEPFSFVPT